MDITILIALAVGALLGLVLGWVLHSQKSSARFAATEAVLDLAQKSSLGLQQEVVDLRSGREAAREMVAALEAQLASERKAAEEKLAILKDFESGMKDTFGALASDALSANAKHLLEYNRAQLDAQKTAVNGSLTEKENSIASMLAPMRDSIKSLAEHSRNLELQREGAYSAILAEVKNIQQSHTDLRRETTQLVQALRAPKVRGNWGEMQLRRCVEHAGMVEYASFDVERFVRGDESSVRPDLIVRLPNERCIVVDAKTPLDAFLNAGACEDETLRLGLMREHAGAVKKHLDSLSSKAYWNRFRDSPDFVVCFLPSEVLFSAALEQDPTLLEYSASSKVLLATPTTLIALLKAVAYGWQQAQTARDAELIREVATNLYKKFAGFQDSLLVIGTALERAGKAYDGVITRAEGRGGLFSIARRLKDLKIGEKDISEGKPIGLLPRQMQHEDWEPRLSLVASGEELSEQASD